MTTLMQDTAHEKRAMSSQVEAVGRELTRYSLVDRIRSTAVAAVFLRLALAAGFLSAVADRFGLWGPAGARPAGTPRPPPTTPSTTAAALVRGRPSS